jgi:hypothetical protein
MLASGILLKAHQNVRFSEKIEVVGDGFDRSGALHLALQFLQRDNLRRGAQGHREDLPEQSRPPDHAERQHIATYHGFKDRVPDVGAPPIEIIAKGVGLLI